MATHSSIVAWRIPWREEPDGLQSMGSQRVEHDWSTLVCMHAQDFLICATFRIIYHVISEKAMASHSITLAWKIPWVEEPGRVGSPWDRKELDKTERLQFHFSLSCIGEGNGNPLQCSCLENPKARGPWWASVYGVAQSQTGLKRPNRLVLCCQFRGFGLLR